MAVNVHQMNFSPLRDRRQTAKTYFLFQAVVPQNSSFCFNRMKLLCNLRWSKHQIKGPPFSLNH